VSYKLKQYKNILNINREQLLKYPDEKKYKYKKRIKKLVFRIAKLEKNRDPFFWPNGLLAIGLENSHKIYNKNDDINILEKYYKKWQEIGQPIEKVDHAINGYSLIYLYEQTEKKEYLEMVENIVKFIDNHKKDNLDSLPYSPSGDKIFIDSLGMICPFLCRYGYLTNQTKYIDLAIAQILNFCEFGFDNDSKFPYHAYELNTKEKFGIIGWGRAVGWLMIALVDSIEYIKKDHPDYLKIKNIITSLSEEIVKYQQEKGSYSWQLKAIEGPSDSSSTSMINYAMFKAIKLGIISKKYVNNVDLSINYLLSVTKKGFVMDCSAECKGLGQYPQLYDWYPWSQGLTTALLSLKGSSQ